MAPPSSPPAAAAGGVLAADGLFHPGLILLILGGVHFVNLSPDLFRSSHTCVAAKQVLFNPRELRLSHCSQEVALQLLIVDMRGLHLGDPHI